MGLIGFAAGFRVVPDAAFAATAAKLGRPMTAHAFGTPSALLPLTYRVDRTWSVLVDFGYGLDHYRLAGDADVSLRTFTLQAGAQYAFDFGFQRLEVFAEAGTGYYLSTFTKAERGGAPTSAEAHTSGSFVGLGGRYALTSALGLSLEERFAFANVGLADIADASVGGNTVSLGVYYVWQN